MSSPAFLEADHPREPGGRFAPKPVEEAPGLGALAPGDLADIPSDPHQPNIYLGSNWERAEKAAAQLRVRLKGRAPRFDEQVAACRQARLPVRMYADSLDTGDQVDLNAIRAKAGLAPIGGASRSEVYEAEPQDDGRLLLTCEHGDALVPYSALLDCEPSPLRCARCGELDIRHEGLDHPCE